MTHTITAAPACNTITASAGISQTAAVEGFGEVLNGALADESDSGTASDATVTPAAGSAAQNSQDILNIDELFGFGHVITGADLQGAITEDLAVFKDMLAQTLAEAGIDRDPGFEVGQGADGRLTIDSDRPDKAEIEQALNANKTLRDKFTRISAYSSLLSDFKRAAAFNKAYELDPESAVRQYSYLFDSEPCDCFSIFVSEDSFEPTLESYGREVELECLEGSEW